MPHSKARNISFSALLSPYSHKSLISQVSLSKQSAPYKNWRKGIFLNVQTAKAAENSNSTVIQPWAFRSLIIPKVSLYIPSVVQLYPVI